MPLRPQAALVLLLCSLVPPSPTKLWPGELPIFSVQILTYSKVAQLIKQDPSA